MEEEIRKKEKNGKSSSILIIFLIIIIIGMGCIIGYLGMNKSSQSSNTSKNDNLETVELSIEEVDELLQYVPSAMPYGGLNYGTIDMYYTAYSNEKMTVAEMDANWLIHNTISEMDDYRKSIHNYSTGVDTRDEYLSKMYKGKSIMQVYGGGDCDAYSISDIKKVLERKYGKAEISFPEKVESDFLHSCTKQDGYYICACPNGGYAASDMLIYFGAVAGNSELIIKYETAQKNEKTLYLYVKLARADFKNTDSDSEMSFQIYKDSSAEEKIMDVVNAADFYNKNSTKSFVDSIYEQYKNEMTSYKVTYSQEGAHYSLVSVEPLN